MPTTLDTTTEIQQKFLSGLEASQKAFVTLVGTWAETVESVVAKLPDLVVTEPGKPTQGIETFFGFTEKVLTSQREFAGQVMQAAMPAMKVPATATSAAKSAAAKS